MGERQGPSDMGLPKRDQQNVCRRRFRISTQQLVLSLQVYQSSLVY